MTSRKFTPDQVEDLFEYCYFNSIQYYDLQIEVVDHLAEAIERIWETNPNMDFEYAIYLAGKQFGGELGFYNIRKEKENALRKKYRRILFNYILEFYKFPRIIFTVLISIGIFSILHLLPNDRLFFRILIILFWLTAAIYALYYYPNKLKLRTPKGYAFLIQNMARKIVLYKTLKISGVLLAIVGHQPYNLTLRANFISSVLIAFYLVLLWGDSYYIPQRINEDFSKEFPQFANT